jgi:hypothetical protein
MRVSCLPSLPVLVISVLLCTISNAGAAVPDGTEAAPRALTPSPQIVRLSYVEGDVRISRGKLGEKADAAVNESATGWEAAVENLPIESGYSLVTGKGRAEIEFEDASVVYVGENSVLTFGELTATGGVPYTEMALLSGAATLNVHTEMVGEVFRMNTPTDHVTLRYPQHAYLRVNSYLDSIAITPLRLPVIGGEGVEGNGSGIAAATKYYSDGMRQIPPKTADATSYAEWDAWVDQRVKAREQAIAATMKDAGLNEPIPGLAEMSGQGHFFACAPYGTCWEPTNGWEGHATDVALVTTKPGDVAVETQHSDVEPAVSASGPRPNAPATKMPKPSAVDMYLAAHPGALLHTEDYFFPCSDYPSRDVIATDPVTGKETVVDSYFDLNYGLPLMNAGFPFGYRGRGPGFFMNMGGWSAAPWDWAVCHAGTWIRWRRHYVWVAGTHRHHHGPYRWVRNGRNSGYVPMHPRDVAGKPPVNLKDGLFKWSGKRGEPVERVAYEEGKSLKVMSAPPKEFLRADLEPLKPVEVPVAEAHEAYRSEAVSRVATAGKTPSEVFNAAKGTSRVEIGGAAKTEWKQAGTPITFDRKSQSFAVARPTNEGGRPSTVAEPLVGRGMGGQGGYMGSNAGRANGGASYGNNGASTSRSNAPAASYNNGANNSSRSYTPAPAYNNSSSGAGSYRPSAPAPAPSYSPPAPSYSPPAAASSGASQPQPARH